MIIPWEAMENPPKVGVQGEKSPSPGSDKHP